MSLEKIDQKVFFKLLAEEGYTTTIVFDFLESGKASTGDIENFNKVLRDISSKHGLKIFDMIVYIESLFSEYKKIIDLLDNGTKKILEDEIEQNYYIKKQKSKFEELM